MQTREMKLYLLKFAFRAMVFLGVLGMYLFDKQRLYTLMTTPIRFGVNALQVLWAAFMIIMLTHIFPIVQLTMAHRKANQAPYHRVEEYSELELLRFVQDQNRKAWRVMLVWLCFNAVFGLLYLLKVIAEADLLMLTVFYFLSDYLCILFVCPFQHFIMHNSCCVNCRIYDWGHFMMFTPMLFIRNFFSWSLFFTSVVVLIRWEMRYAKYPERFWKGSNSTLQCQNCKDRTCKYKRQLAHILGIKED